MQKLSISALVLIFFLALDANSGYLSLLDMKWEEPVILSELDTDGDEFAPSWNSFEGILYYNSLKYGYSSFMTSKFLDNQSFDVPKPLAGGLNQSGNNQSYITFIDEDEALLSTFYLFEKRSYLNIFSSTKKKMAWSQPIVLDSLLSECFNSHPTVSPDGTYMIFSTNRNSENGDTDLWQAVRQSNGGWGSLIPIDELNSPGNEITPFLASPDTLFFATDGQDGPGGFDIFISIRYDGIWQTPVPLSGINSQFNDSDPGLIPGDKLIFSSDRPGGKGGLDLYLSKLIIPEKQLAVVAEEEVYIETFISSLNVKKYDYITVSQFPLLIVKNTTNLMNSGDYQLKENSVLNFDSLYTCLPGLLLSRMKELPESTLMFGPCNNISAMLKSNSPDKIQIDPINSNHPDLANFIAKAESLGINNRIRTITSASKDENSCIASFNPELMEPIKLGDARYEIEPPFLEFILNTGSPNSGSGYDCRLSLNGRVIEEINSLKLPDTLRIDLTKYSADVFASDSLSIDLMNSSDSLTIRKSLKLSITKNNLEDFRIYEVGNKKFERYIFFVPGEEYLDLKQYYGRMVSLIDERLRYAKSIIINYFADSEASRKIAATIGEMIKTESKKDQRVITTSYLKKSELLTFSEYFRPFLFQVLLEK